VYLLREAPLLPSAVYNPLGAACNPCSFLQSHCMGGFRFSRMERKVSACKSSLVARLASRSVTGYDAPVEVHQHGSYDLLLMLNRKNYLRRRFFNGSEIDAFCNELIRGRALGAHSCLKHSTMIDHTLETCFRWNRMFYSSESWDDFTPDDYCGVCGHRITFCVCKDYDLCLRWGFCVCKDSKNICCCLRWRKDK
jgi:hypothetical protein